MSTDPVLTDENSAANFNRYTYALNNPYKHVDPDGRLPILFLVPLIVKGADLTLTALEVYSAAQTEQIEKTPNSKSNILSGCLRTSSSKVHSTFKNMLVNTSPKTYRGTNFKGALIVK